MQVKDIMTRGIETIMPTDSVAMAARRMKDLCVGALPVKEGNSIIGILTRQDIVNRSVAEEHDPRQTFVNQIMTRQMVCCSEHESIEEAATIMEKRNIHRLLILNDENKPVGMLSLSDLAVKAGNEHLVWEVLERISEPATPNR